MLHYNLLFEPMKTVLDHKGSGLNLCLCIQTNIYIYLMSQISLEFCLIYHFWSFYLHSYFVIVIFVYALMFLVIIIFCLCLITYALYSLAGIHTPYRSYYAMFELQLKIL